MIASATFGINWNINSNCSDIIYLSFCYILSLYKTFDLLLFLRYGNIYLTIYLRKLIRETLDTNIIIVYSYYIAALSVFPFLLLIFYSALLSVDKILLLLVPNWN